MTILIDLWQETVSGKLYISNKYNIWRKLLCYVWSMYLILIKNKFLMSKDEKPIIICKYIYILVS